MVFKYSQWDGTQEPFELDDEELLDQVADSLYQHGDPDRALRDLLRRGIRRTGGRDVPGLRDLLERLSQRRNERLRRYDLDSVIDDLRERLDEVIEAERAGAQRSVDDAQKRLEYATPQDAEQFSGLMDLVRRRAEETTRKLDSLPPNLAGAVRELSNHDFIDEGARAKFQKLLDMLRERMLKTVAQQAGEAIRNMTPEQQQALREMLRALNDMLRERARGGEPDFDGFMQRFGDFFGAERPGSLDELLDMLQRQMAQMQSLFNSMSPELQGELADLISEALDPDTLSELGQLAGLVDQLRPLDQLASEYPFMGAESLTLDQAMDVMEGLQELDDLERSLRDATAGGGIEGVDPEEVERLLGEDSREALEQLADIARRLEEQGVIQQRDGRWELTPRAIRKLGEKALREVFGRLAKGRVGGHRIEPAGRGGDLTGETKPYEFGEPFDLNLHRSLMNAVTRRGSGIPVAIEVADFEVDIFESMTTAATVLLLDQSSSTRRFGRWTAAKKVAMALQALIQGQYPRDRLFLIGFSDYARQLELAELPSTAPNEQVQGTNMHHALMLARKLLSKERAGTRQVIMITDGEPTAHLEHGVSWFDYPPSRRTLVETLREVKRCTAAGIVINTFMLDRSSYLTAFVDYMTRINRGRAFYTTPEELGDYVLVDYVSNRRRRIS